ncbi:MAG: hypothetical protein AUH29_05030 [Candidatus Rokubacteria bacterium 13_1_40CM_69_27]|nr:MAG: hypothetical protein AUH29_05030 [Candidatus Rokubacteria bacterium 13_1_40CM_69_27]
MGDVGIESHAEHQREEPAVGLTEIDRARAAASDRARQGARVGGEAEGAREEVLISQREHRERQRPAGLVDHVGHRPAAGRHHALPARADSPSDRSDALGPLPYDDRFQPPASQCRRQGLDMRGVGPAPAYGLAAIAILRAGLDVMGG